MKAWRQWNRFDWSEALLSSYFGLLPDGPSEPVRILVVTDDRLCHVVGESPDAPEDVRHAMIEKTLRSVGSENFWRHASDQSGDKPYYLAHLIVACVAAIDIGDLDERSYLKRLEEIAGPTASHSIELMPELWQRLQRWLAKRPEEYRPIVLPDPRSWVRIGHTTRLAFPTRTDQAKLHELLAEQGLSPDELPLGVVIHALERGRKGFSKRFIDELDAFQVAVRAGASAAALYETSLWSAVTSASWLDFGDKSAGGRQRWTIVALDDGYEFDLRIVTCGDDSDPQFKLLHCDEPFGPWNRELPEWDGHPAVAAVLAGNAPSLGSLSALTRGGVIPLADAAHGAMEVASKRDLEFATIALVADDCLDEVRSRFGGTRTSLSGAPGWSAVRNVHLRTAPPEDLKGCCLERCWILHDTPFPDALRMVGGVRVGDAYLAKPSMLPHIRAFGASSLSATVGDLELDLKEHDGYWWFQAPGTAFEGERDVVLRARFPAGDRVCRLRFAASASTEAFKELGDPNAWQVEGAAASQALTSSSEMYASTLGPIVADVDWIVRLGRDVGIFATDVEGTTWEIAAFGSKRCGRLVASEIDAIPTHRSASEGDRRRWRKWLSGAEFNEGDSGRTVSRRIVTNGRTDRVLPEAVPQGPGNPLIGQSISCRTSEHPGLRDLVDIVIALANRSAGIEPSLWRRLGQEILGLEREQFETVSRAWSEASLLNETVSRRWSTRRIMFVPPHLMVFRTDRWVGASLQGLALPTTRFRFSEASVTASLLVEPIRSRSGLVPDGLALRADSIEQIRAVASELGIPIRYLRFDPFHWVRGRDLTKTPPGNYERSTYRNDLQSIEGVAMSRWWRSGSPGLWTVRSSDHFTWSHFESAAVFWASAFAGRRALRFVGEGRLRREGAYLPLTAARWLSALAPVRSGPDPSDGWAYYYETPSNAFAQRLSRSLDDFAASRMPELSAPSQ